MFFRATDEFNGSGLGLYIVKETVEKLKGRITVRSKMRVGSTFRVVLPNLKERFEAAPKLDDYSDAQASYVTDDEMFSDNFQAASTKMQAEIKMKESISAVDAEANKAT